MPQADTRHEGGNDAQADAWHSGGNYPPPATAHASSKMACHGQGRTNTVNDCSTTTNNLHLRLCNLHPPPALTPHHHNITNPHNTAATSNHTSASIATTQQPRHHSNHTTAATTMPQQPQRRSNQNATANTTPPQPQTAQ